MSELDLALLRVETALKRRQHRRPSSRWAELASRDYPELRKRYRDTIYLAVLGYLVQTGKGAAKFKNEVKQAIVEAMPDAFYAAYKAGDGEVDPEDETWLTAKMNAEIGFVDFLFQQMKELKDGLVPPAVYVETANGRADGYARTLDGVFTEARLRGNKNVMLTMVGEDGEESCRDCRSRKGKRMSAKTWAKRGWIPGQPGNENYKCRGYKCRHRLVDDEGKIWTF